MIETLGDLPSCLVEDFICDGGGALIEEAIGTLNAGGRSDDYWEGVWKTS